MLCAVIGPGVESSQESHDAGVDSWINADNHVARVSRQQRRCSTGREGCGHETDHVTTSAVSWQSAEWADQAVMPPPPCSVLDKAEYSAFESTYRIVIIVSYNCK